MYAIAASVLALSALASAAPSVKRGSSVPVVVSGGSSSSSISHGGFSSVVSPMSFNNWGGFQCLSNFDDFFGSNNFCGNNNQQTIITQTVTCETQSITLIQQQLSILTEFAKRLVTEQICQVEVQTIVWSQFIGGLSSFGDDLRHVSGRSIGYDSVIASHISGLVDSHNNIIHSDFGFSGSSIGSSLLVPSGFNWQDGVSQVSCQQALLSSQVAQLASSSSLIHSSSVSSSGSFVAPSGTFEVQGF